MSWIDRMFGREDVQQRIEELESRVRVAEEQRSIDTLPWNVGGTQGSTSTPSATRALRLAPVYGAVSMIARSIASLPLRAYRQAGASSPRQKLPYLPSLFTSPSVHGELSDWLHRCMMSLLLHGNAYGLITARDHFGYPTMIEWLDPQQVQVLDENMWGKGSYWDPIYYWRGRVIDADQLVHIPWFTVPFRVKGLSPLSAFASAVDIGLEGQRFTADWFRAGGVPPGTFKNAAKVLTEDEANKVKARLTSAIRTHEPLVYGADWDFKPIQVSPHEADFILTHQLSATDIAVVYGIYPAERIGGETKTSMTYSNVEADQIQWTNITLLPYAAKLESHFFGLLPSPQFVKFDLNAQIRSDTRTRHEIHQIDRQIGLKNIDEVREEEDLAPLPKEQGKIYDPLEIMVAAARGEVVAEIKAGQQPYGQQGAPSSSPNGVLPPQPVQPNGNGSKPQGARSTDDILADLRRGIEELESRDRPGPARPSASYEGTSEMNLIRWFERGEGAAKIQWGVPGDFDRCLALAGQHMAPGKAKGFCANRHKSVTGAWPGHAPGEKLADRSQDDEPDDPVESDAMLVRYRVLALRAESDEERQQLLEAAEKRKAELASSASGSK